MTTTKRELEAVFQSPWDDGADAAEKILQKAGWSKDENSTESKLFASSRGSGGKLRMIELKSGQIVRIVVPEKLKGSPEKQLAEMQDLIKEVTSLIGCEAEESDVSDDWTWAGAERTAKYSVTDDDATLEVTRA